MLYELATGEGAFLGETIPQILSQIQTVDPNKLAAAVPKPFANVVSRALVCDAHDRDITMQEIADALAYPGRRDMLGHAKRDVEDRRGFE